MQGFRLASATTSVRVATTSPPLALAVNTNALEGPIGRCFFAAQNVRLTRWGKHSEIDGRASALRIDDPELTLLTLAMRFLACDPQ